MGEYAISMPDIGEGIAEAELVGWLVGVGDEVALDAPLAEVMTDKARVQIPSPVAGTVLRLAAEPGELVAVGSELIRLEVAGDGPAEQTQDRKTPSVSPTPPPPQTPPPQTPTPQTPPEPTTPPVAGTVLAAPAVRARARDAGIALGDVPGTGPEGRVTARDLAAHLGAGSSGLAGGSDEVAEIPVTGVRRVMARRMLQAWTQIPHITIIEEVDVTEMESLRTKLNAGNRPRTTLVPFVVLAVVCAVREQPDLNAHVDDAAETIRRFTAVHVGIATQGVAGLTVPVVRNAERLDLREAAQRVAEVTEAARDGRASREDLTGSTITITSLGKLGAIATTPIVNRPEVAIVGVNRMAVRPLWNGSSFVPRTVLNLSCSFDHRVVDGWAGATFVARLKELLETPALLIMTHEKGRTRTGPLRP